MRCGWRREDRGGPGGAGPAVGAGARHARRPPSRAAGRALRRPRTEAGHAPTARLQPLRTSPTTRTRLGEKYELLMEGAKFADANGFSAIWTPERHFHAFGGLYPQPAVTAPRSPRDPQHAHSRGQRRAAAARSDARRGGVVRRGQPLAGPRGHSFATGWQRERLRLRARELASVAKPAVGRPGEVRRLWRGGTVRRPGATATGGSGTSPRPVQAELPVWLTAAGNPETFRHGGRAGRGRAHQRARSGPAWRSWSQGRAVPRGLSQGGPRRAVATSR